MSIRTDKLAQAILREVSTVIHRDLRDPHIGFVTVTRVDVSPDLRYARLYVSVLGNNDDIEESLSHLRKALGFIRHRIAPALDLRYAPELSLVHDDTEIRAERIEKLIDQISEEGGEGPSGEEG
jgi:ribosome-binding factor A